VFAIRISSLIVYLLKKISTHSQRKGSVFMFLLSFELFLVMWALPDK
jgi:hypothetical protein